jgi:hypothetical protein
LSAFEKLGLTDTATQAEVNAAYDTLRKKYSEERFAEGETGNDATRRLMEVETAYADLVQLFRTREMNEKYGSYGEIDNLIKQNNLDEAQRLLDAEVNRTGEWHYLQSIVFYKRNWYDESKKQLQLAVALEPANEKYKTALTRLEGILGSARPDPAFTQGPQAGRPFGPNPEASSAAEGNMLTNCCMPLCCCMDCMYCCR